MNNLNIICAVSSNGGIGLKGKLPWHFKSDLHFFSKITSQGNNAIIMGRKTWEGLPYKPLKNRYNIILTNNVEYECKQNNNENNIKVLNSFDEIFRFNRKKCFDTL